MNGSKKKEGEKQEMEKQLKQFVQQAKPAAHPDAVVLGEKYRFTILTDRLIRMEYQEEGKFNDSVTQRVVCRLFDPVKYRVIDGPYELEIITDDLHLYYDKKKFSPEGLSVQMKGGFAVYGSNWHYGDVVHDLRGTARTLDNVDGEIELEPGLLSRDGFTVLDDSKSALLSEDGNTTARQIREEDLYFFGYGHDYLGCLKDFYRLCGKVPMLPRYALGNWWSRFFAYTEDSYLKLMDRFRKHEIPLAVAVIDMDWHLTRLPEKYGSGWTGYTWNREYFPDPERFLNSLHERGLHVTLNVHPADGVRAHEEAYPQMAEALGVDAENEDKIPFDSTDPDFMEAYFRYLHHPNEEIGVDFWWIDWQQGSNSGIAGVDTLWQLNHAHFLDSGRDGKRPITFSRYAGIGSHRYPVGFSGDTVSSWKSLAFQPYFTATASNAGYTWWSHDIGGHQNGIKDDELIIRWVQYGVFSPIMRLHSTCNIFYGKEPWNYNMVAEKVITYFLQLRHRLIPYLYTMNHRMAKEDEPLIQPMYYRHDVPAAYEVPNEYYFGSEMIVCPITEQIDKETLLAEFDAWLPEGMYFDFFNGNVYRGGRKMKMYRYLHELPVLLKAGSILPMAIDYMDSHRKNPQILEVWIYHGGSGSFTLYEDDCEERMDARSVTTDFTYRYDGGKDAVFSMQVSSDNQDLIPKEREYQLVFAGVAEPEQVEFTSKEQTSIEWDYRGEEKQLRVKVTGNHIRAFSLKLKYEKGEIRMRDKEDILYEILSRMQISYNLKAEIYDKLRTGERASRILSALYEMQTGEKLYGALMEILTMDS